MFKEIKTAEQLQQEKDIADKKSRIQELNQLLLDSDFKILPDYDQDSTQIKADRQAWRDEIRQLKSEVQV